MESIAVIRNPRKLVWDILKSVETLEKELVFVYSFIYFIYIYLFSIFKKICIYSFHFHIFISRQSWVLNKEATIIHKISETNSSFHAK